MTLLDRCREDSPLRCAWRAGAMQREDFRHIEGVGWIWFSAINPGRPWHSCPGCGGSLPPMAGEVERPPKPTVLDSYRQADGLSDGEGAE